MQKIFSQQMCFLKRKQKIICNFALTLTFSFVSLNILSNNVSAVYTPTLSASIDQSELTVNGNQIINSTSKSTNLTLNLKVNTNNKTGYTTTISSETENTALINTNPGGTDKISSISDITSLNGFSANTWGYKLSNNTDYNPIPALSSPANLIQTTAKTNGDEVNNIDLGIKLGNNLESGNYKNKLIFSVVTNYYEEKAILSNSKDFNEKLNTLMGIYSCYAKKKYGINIFDYIGNLENMANINIDLSEDIEGCNKNLFHLGGDYFSLMRDISGFLKSNTPPLSSDNPISVEDDSSDFPISVWVDKNNGVIRFYSLANKIYLNPNSRALFAWFYLKKGFDTQYIDTSMVTDMSYMFYEQGWYSDNELDLSNFNTSNVTTMEGMFECDGECTHDFKINLSSFNTRKLINAKNMFKFLIGTKKLDLSSFYTPNLINMEGMFSHCSALTDFKIPNITTDNVVNMKDTFAVFGYNKLDITNFNTSRVANFEGTFSGMLADNDLDLSNLDTSSAINMSEMFMGNQTKKIILSHKFNTTKVTDMTSMFSSMHNITELDLSNAVFDTSKVIKISWIFGFNSYGLHSKLQKIYVNQDFDITEAKKYRQENNLPDEKFFERQEILRGGNGSFKSDPSKADLTWLRIDRPGAPGYFTQK